MSLIDFVCNGELESSLRGARSEAGATKQSKLNCHTERSEVSKTRESSIPSESMTEKRINKSDSPLRHCDSYNLDSRDLDSSLNSRFAQNDESSVWVASANLRNASQ